MTPEQMTEAFDQTLDAPLLYHGFTPYFRDYQLIWFADNAPWFNYHVTATARPFLRWLFIGCIRVETTMDPAPPDAGEPLFSDRYIRDDNGNIPAMDDDPVRG